MLKKSGMLCLALSAIISTQAGAQTKDSTTNNKIKPYKDIITEKAQTDSGLFLVHKVAERYYFEIPDSLLGRDMMLVSRVAKGAADYSLHAKGWGYAGDQFGEGVVKFEKGPDNRIFLRQVFFQERSADSSSNGLYRSVSNSNIQPIIASFPVKAFSPVTKDAVIEITDLVKGDNEVLYFSANDKKSLALESWKQTALMWKQSIPFP